MKYVEYTRQNQRKWEQSLIDCYKQIFAAPPWNEHWWTDDLVHEVLSHYAGPNASIVLALDGVHVIGFACGAFLCSGDLSRELELALPYPTNQVVGYLKDIGVAEPYRHHGVARSLAHELTNKISQHCDCHSLILARTLATPEPSVLYHWFPKIGFSTIAHYPEGSERVGQVILGSRFSDVSF